MGVIRVKDLLKTRAERFLTKHELKKLKLKEAEVKAEIKDKDKETNKEEK